MIFHSCAFKGRKKRKIFTKFFLFIFTHIWRQFKCGGRERIKLTLSCKEEEQHKSCARKKGLEKWQKSSHYKNSFKWVCKKKLCLSLNSFISIFVIFVKAMKMWLKQIIFTDKWFSLCTYFLKKKNEMNIYMSKKLQKEMKSTIK